ncbi:hypothetical protein ASG01_10630 [Chryseobacterium sp. Leaf180]|uniref:DUF2339 domain-containing protein n=1 Tax=Chryseobacterium sp. Leaf180 TaxID=1736289 RepID=UPI0006F44B92|nr:DUF2339 domain-containing protein [Chryseobacterium sp. Leaf180]KQR93612.1 hypothetical protein ASG01_10630 [Chryseobacterium sp. Leaf180]
MEIFLLLAILVFVIFIFIRSNKNHQDIQNSITNLHEKINYLQSEISLSAIKKAETEASADEAQTAVETVIAEQPPVSEPGVMVGNFEDEIVPEYFEDSYTKPQEVFEKEVTFASNNLTEVSEPKKSWVEKFKENNPDIEKFIGENLINKIGILILVLGISFFVKYAIDKDWINEPARVGIGILAGALVMGVAHRLKRNYKAFSSVFVAGAVSIFYLTIGIAFHDYHLFGQTAAFAIMVVITAFSVFVSVSYDRKELAVLSLLGGFAVPFMVSTGQGNYIVLFTYIAILNVGMLLIAYFKKWNLVTLLAFIFTCSLYSAWFGQEIYSNTLPYRGALFFATLFYLIFSVATVVNNLRNKGVFNKLEYFIIIANTFFYFGMGITILAHWNADFKGIFTVALALYNLVYAAVLYRKFGLDKNAIFMLIGLTLTFITLAIPIQFKGNYITLFWAAEAVLLFWLAQKSKIITFRIGAITVQGLMLISLMLDWDFYYGGMSNVTLKPFLNPIFITGIISTASLVLSYFILLKEKEPTSIFRFKFNPVNYKKAILSAGIFIGYLTGIFEILYQSDIYISNPTSATAFSVLYHYIFSTVLIYFILKNKNKILNSFAFVLIAVNLILYIANFYRLTYDEITNNFVLDLSAHAAFVIHYIILACIIYFIIVLFKSKNETVFTKYIDHKLSLWVAAFAVVYILSNEVMIHGLMLTRDIVTGAELAKFPLQKGELYNYPKENFVESKLWNVKRQITKIGYPILWGVLSFVFLIIGIKKQIQQLRIIALSLLGITILKLFLYDIKNVSETGKIIAFILLGVLILIISFVYQKIKKLVVDETKKTDNEENI